MSKFSAVFNCIKLVVNSSYVNPDISNNDQDERQSSKKSSYEKIAISLVPISKQYGATQTDSPFPYFEQTLILWIEKQKSVSSPTVACHKYIHDRKILKVLTYLPKLFKHCNTISGSYWDGRGHPSTLHSIGSNYRSSDKWKP